MKLDPCERTLVSHWLQQVSLLSEQSTLVKLLEGYRSGHIILKHLHVKVKKQKLKKTTNFWSWFSFLVIWIRSFTLEVIQFFQWKFPWVRCCSTQVWPKTGLHDKTFLHIRKPLIMGLDLTSSACCKSVMQLQIQYMVENRRHLLSLNQLHTILRFLKICQA